MLKKNEKLFFVDEEQLKSICSEKKISIRYLEYLSGIANGSIGKWCKSNPSINSVASIAEVLDVPIEDLIIYQEK